MAVEFDPLLGQLRIKDTGGGSNTIPEYTSDPVSPSSEETWVLKSGGGGSSGIPYGLLLALTQPGGSVTYQLSYRTLENSTVRTTLS